MHFTAVNSHLLSSLLLSLYGILVPGLPHKSSELLSTLSIVIRLSALSPNCRLPWIRTNYSIYVSQQNQEKGWKRWKGKSRRPCHLRFAHKEPSPAVLSLPSCLGEPVAVIQDSHVDPLLPQLLPLLLAFSFSLRGLPLLLADDAASIGTYTTAPSKLVQTPDCWVNAMITAF